VIDDFHWSSCADARPCVVDPRLVSQGGEHAQLVRRCEFLRGETCAKQKIPCDYEQSDGGITQALADALKTTHEDAVRAFESPTLIEVKSDDARAIEIIASEYAVKSKLTEIADRLNREQIPPPNGRKWTSPKVSLIAKRNQITKPRPVKKSKAELILERDGHWAGYWPDSHPLTTPNAQSDLVPSEEGGERVVDSDQLLTRIYGRVMTVKRAFEGRVIREEIDQ
tara:strand:+ start:237 stop:911 length:675 start_codon:yes stop_codon:yes gene_type:complete